MAGATPDQVAAEWSQRLGGSTEKIRRGVQAVSVAPGQLAARQKATYVANVNASQDKWASRVASVPLSSWQADMLDKGLQRIGSGATAAQGKFAQFMTAFLPHVESGRRSLPPRGNLDQNIARMTAMVRHNASFRRSAPGG